MKQNILRTIDGLHLGQTVQYKNLSIIPIFSNNTSTPDFISLKEGLDKGLVEITEVSESGSVPTLRVINNSSKKLFIMDGEELVGAKQNRIVNTSMLLGGNSSFDVPVSCTEKGRWKYNSRKFQDSGIVMSSKARYAKSERVTKSLRRMEGYNANQSSIWKDIEKMHRKYSTSSNTRAMKDAFLQKQNDIQEYLDAFPIQENQKGMFVFQNGKLVGGEYVSNAKVYGDLHEKLLKSFSIEAMHDKIDYQADPFDLIQEASRNLNSLKDATATVHKPVGLGSDIRLEADKAKASVLEYDNEDLHISIYPKAEVNDSSEDTPILEIIDPKDGKRKRIGGNANPLPTEPNIGETVSKAVDMFSKLFK